MIRTIVYIFFLVIFCHHSYSQLTSNAGGYKTVCLNGSASLGGAPTAVGGTPPYTYNWTPGTFLNSTSVSNPIASNITADTWYNLTVTDANGNVSTNTAFIGVNKIYKFNAGIDTGYCFGQQAGIKIGDPQNDNSFHNFTWSPTTGLDNPTAPNPIATPAVTTVYQLTVFDGSCPTNISSVTVSAFMPPYINAGADTTMDEGNTITLQAAGAVKFWWQPDYNIKYGNTATPDVWPITTTSYTLYTEDSHKCYNYDDITVNVINGDHLFFYSAFTPNNDGDNDYFYIGNVDKFPDNNLKIYNRYGKLIFSGTNYVNTWDGTYLGNEIPTGVYFYIFSDGKEKTYKGTVTLMR